MFIELKMFGARSSVIVLRCSRSKVFSLYYFWGIMPCCVSYFFRQRFGQRCSVHHRDRTSALMVSTQHNTPKTIQEKRVIVVWTKKKEGEYMKRMWMEEEAGDARGRNGTIKLLESGHVTSRNNRRECVTRCMNVNEARSLRQDRVVWRSVLSAYPCGETAWWLVS